MNYAAIVGAGSILFCATSAMAQSPAVERIDRFLQAVIPVCAAQASTDCYEVAFASTDSDGDEFVSLPELEALKTDLRGWSDARWSELSPTERSGLAIGFFVVDAVGLTPLFESYDANTDDLLSRAELSADIRLDQRTIEQLVRDRDAVDWQGVRSRLGHLSPILEPYAQPR